MKLITAIPFFVFTAFGCERKDPLNTKVQDLQNARVEAQKDSKSIRADLEDAKKELARLKLTLDQATHAKTAEVLEQEAKVRAEVQKTEKEIDVKKAQAENARRSLP